CGRSQADADHGSDRDARASRRSWTVTPSSPCRRTPWLVPPARGVPATTSAGVLLRLLDEDDGDEAGDRQSSKKEGHRAPSGRRLRLTAGRDGAAAAPR